MKMIRSLPEFAESFNFDETEKKIMIRVSQKTSKLSDQVADANPGSL